jgi:hypothetical protein
MDFTGDCPDTTPNGLYVPGTVDFATLDSSGNLSYEYSYNDDSGNLTISAGNISGFGGWDWSASDVTPGLDLWHSSPQCPNCGNIWNGANNAVIGASIYTGAGIVIVVGAPAAVTAYSATSDALLELEAASPGTVNATADIIRSVISPLGATPPATMGGLIVRAIIVWRRSQ